MASPPACWRPFTRAAVAVEVRGVAGSGVGAESDSRQHKIRVVEGDVETLDSQDVVGPPMEQTGKVVPEISEIRASAAPGASLVDSRSIPRASNGYATPGVPNAERATSVPFT